MGAGFGGLAESRALRKDVTSAELVVGPVIAAVKRFAAQPQSAMMRVWDIGFRGRRQPRLQGIQRIEIRVLQLRLGAVDSKWQVVPSELNLVVLGVGSEIGRFRIRFSEIFPEKWCRGAGAADDNGVLQQFASANGVVVQLVSLESDSGRKPLAFRRRL